MSLPRCGNATANSRWRHPGTSSLPQMSYSYQYQSPSVVCNLILVPRPYSKSPIILDSWSIRLVQSKHRKNQLITALYKRFCIISFLNNNFVLRQFWNWWTILFVYHCWCCHDNVVLPQRRHSCTLPSLPPSPSSRLIVVIWIFGGVDTFCPSRWWQRQHHHRCCCLDSLRRWLLPSYQFLATPCLCTPVVCYRRHSSFDRCLELAVVLFATVQSTSYNSSMYLRTIL